MILDMWHGDKLDDVDHLDVYWSDLDCVYRGNIYIGRKMVGDYEAKTVKEIERTFPKLKYQEA